MVGPTGTGKTINVKGQLDNHYSNSTYTNLVTSFSGKTSCTQIQRFISLFRQIETKMCSKIRKGRYGPEDNKDRCVVFIDDFNMPIKQKYGSQPPIEIIRQ